MQIVFHLLRGVAIGLANIIPGVSGGTMALILGIYQRLITAVGNLGVGTVTAVFRGKDAFVEAMRKIDALFLMLIAVGALGAIAGVARLLTYLLEHQHDPTYGFFFGLVLMSVVVPYKMIKRRGIGVVLSALAAVALVVGLTLAMSGEERLASAQKKAAIKALKAGPAQAAVSATGGAMGSGTTTRVPRDARTMALFFLAGAVAISAMLLPGISGSFMLLLMGVYFDVLACVTGRQFVLLGIFALGCLAGMVVFTRLLKFLLARFHDLTMAFLLGLVIGSLYAIWPFKSYGMAGGKRVDMANILPQALGHNELWTIGAAVVGCAIVAVFIWIEARQGRGEPTTT